MEIKFDQVKSIANGIYNADFKKLLKTLKNRQIFDKIKVKMKLYILKLINLYMY